MNELHFIILAAFSAPFIGWTIAAAISLAAQRQVMRARAECNKATIAHIKAVRRG